MCGMLSLVYGLDVCMKHMSHDLLYLLSLLIYLYVIGTSQVTHQGIAAMMDRTIEEATVILVRVSIFKGQDWITVFSLESTSSKMVSAFYKVTTMESQ